MLSILIPIYNFDVNELVLELHRQGMACQLDFEIRCYDDGSQAAFKHINRPITKLNNVLYEELPENLGRSKIRNHLGKTARYEHLLFMDCDSKVNHPDYLQQYLKILDANSLIYGGGSYASKPPSDPQLYFHWYYGKYREQLPVEDRKQQGHHGFKTNNFLLPKAIFLKILFDESLTQYGHEDTLFGLELAKRKIPIIHIDNPLEHIGLETSSIFLKKNQQAIENLWKLSKNNSLIDTKLLRAFRQLEQFGLSGFFLKGYQLFEKHIKENLHSTHPNLRYFDFYKLAILVRCSQQID